VTAQPYTPEERERLKRVRAVTRQLRPLRGESLVEWCPDSDNYRWLATLEQVEDAARVAERDAARVEGQAWDVVGVALAERDAALDAVVVLREALENARHPDEFGDSNDTANALTSTAPLAEQRRAEIEKAAWIAGRNEAARICDGGGPATEVAGIIRALEPPARSAP
jgi:hypothetical protein